MENINRIQSTFDANNQIAKQVEHGNLILRTASARKGKIMRLEGFTDYTLSYKDKAREEFEKKIGKKLQSRIYVQVWYEYAFAKSAVLGYFTLEEFEKMPKKWGQFKRFVKKFKEEEENKQKFYNRQINFDKKFNYNHEKIEELDPRQCVYVDNNELGAILQKYGKDREVYIWNNLRGTTLVIRTLSNETMFNWNSLKKIN